MTTPALAQFFQDLDYSVRAPNFNTLVRPDDLFIVEVPNKKKRKRTPGIVVKTKQEALKVKQMSDKTPRKQLTLFDLARPNKKQKSDLFVLPGVPIPELPWDVFVLIIDLLPILHIEEPGSMGFVYRDMFKSNYMTVCKQWRKQIVQSWYYRSNKSLVFIRLQKSLSDYTQ